MNIKKVPPRWQGLGFSSEEDMNEHEAICKRRKAQIDYIAKLIDRGRRFDWKAEKENENGRD